MNRIALKVLPFFFMFPICVQSQQLCNVQGIMNLDSCNIFVNITSFRYTADNEVSFPTLFTIELPSTLCDYWYNVNTISQYIFSFEDKQHVFVFDWAKPGHWLVDSMVVKLKNHTCELISRDSANEIIHGLEVNSLERDLWLEHRNLYNSSSINRRYYVARSNEILFVFYNIKNIDPKRMVNSFKEIRPHNFIITDDE